MSVCTIPSCLRAATGSSIARPRIVPLGPLLGLALSGCGTLSVLHPPGRDMSRYDSCLSAIDFGSGTTNLPPHEVEARLASAIARGTAITTDQSANGIWPAAPPSVAMADDLRRSEHTPFQQFLDCYVGPVDPIDYETRLLRGHIALSMIAQYSASVIDNSAASKKKQYASDAIGMITAAELALRSASWVEYQEASAKSGTTPAPSAPDQPLSPMRFPANVDRTEQIISLAAFADSVAVRNEYGLLLAAAGEAASKTSPTAIGLDVAGQALSAFESAIRYNNHAAADFAAAARTLDRQAEPAVPAGPAKEAVQDLIKNHFSQIPIDPEWANWKILLSTACNKLSAAADTTPTVTCLPTNDQVTQQSPWKSVKAMP